MGQTQPLNKPLISVITPSYNQKDLILWMLQAWEMQTGFSFELIISDDGSSDGTPEAAELAAKQVGYPVKVLRHKDQGFRVARAKNDAIREANGEYILVMDGDTFPGKDTVTKFLPHLNPEVVLHGKRWRMNPNVIRAPFSWKILEAHKTRGEFRGEKLPNLPPGNWMTFSGANCVIPAKLAKEFLWAPDDWNGFGFDDYHFAMRWLTSGRTMQFVDSVAWHIEHANTEGGVENRERLRKLQEELSPKLKKIYGKNWQIHI